MGDDHRMVRGTLTINTKLERARLARQQKRPNEETTDDLDTYNNNLTFPKGLDSTNAANNF